MEWADEYRQLSREASSEPGAWKTSRVEVAREVMLSVTDPRVHTISVMSCTQLLKTELINNVVGYYMHLDPAPIIVMQPTEKLAKTWSQDRLETMIRDTPVLKELFGANKSRESSNTILHKSFPGGHITIVGSNSPSDLASRPIRIVLVDETDKMISGREGDPIKLLSERSATFWNAKKIFVCSPTVEGQSRIAYEYEQSDKRIFEVPCPHCGVRNELKWVQVKFSEQDPETAFYQCEDDACAKPWTEIQRLQAIQLGKWRATAPFKGHAGFRVNKLASPWEPLSKIVEKFISAKKDPDKLKVFINTQLAETWKEKGEAPDWERLFDRRELYPIGSVPAGVVFLTAGVDVQENRIEAEVVGWCRDKQSFSIQHLVFEGSTASEAEKNPDSPWRKLDELLNETWQNPNGVSFSISVMAIDSGFRTQTVYNFCRRYSINRVIAIKGNDSSAVLMNTGSAVDIKKGGHSVKRGFRVFSIGVNLLKTELYGWLKHPTPIEGEPAYPGYCHFPEYEAEFFRQLTAEAVVKKVVKGHFVFQWEKMRERNEALDMRIYARAAASYYGLDRFRAHHWDKITLAMPQKTPQTIEKVNETLKRKRRPSSFL